MKSKVTLFRAGLGIPAPQTADQYISSIHAPLAGYLHCRSEKQEKTFLPGSVYLVTSSSSVSLHVPPESIYHGLYLDFRTLPGLAGRQILEFSTEDDPYLFHLLRAVESLVKAGGSDLQSAITPTLDQILKHFQKKCCIAPIDDPRLEEAIRFIEEHYTQPLHNQDIADHLYVDRRYLIRLFQHHLDMPPYQYLTKYRINQAAAFLKEGKSVAATAALCGYQSENTFRIAFKKIMGVSPSQFQKQL